MTFSLYNVQGESPSTILTKLDLNDGTFDDLMASLEPDQDLLVYL